MFFSAVLLPIFMLIAGVADHPGPLLVPLAVFFVGLVWMLYFVIFGEETQQETWEQGRGELREGRNAQALPPPSFLPASGFGQRRANTADMAQPPSVTEQTTRLLDEE